MIKVSPSLMCAKFTQLEEYIQLLDQAEVDFFHIDVMDGTFAPNFVFGTDDIRTIRELTNRPLDFHLMVDDPAYKLDWFEIRKGDRVAVHLEAQENTQLSLNKLREFEAEVFLAIEVDTQINKLEPYLDQIDGIVAMSVNVGFAGRPIVEQSFSKVEGIHDLLVEKGHEHLEIECDGSMSVDNAKRMHKLGANSFVLGTAAIFNGHPEQVLELLENFRTQVNAVE